MRDPLLIFLRYHVKKAETEIRRVRTFAVPTNFPPGGQPVYFYRLPRGPHALTGNPAKPRRGFPEHISWAQPSRTSSIVWSSRTYSQNLNDKVWPKVADRPPAARHRSCGPGTDYNL